MLQRTALTVVLVATCAICLSLVWAQTHPPIKPPNAGMLASNGITALPPT